MKELCKELNNLKRDLADAELNLALVEGIHPCEEDHMAYVMVDDNYMEEVLDEDSFDEEVMEIEQEVELAALEVDYIKEQIEDVEHQIFEARFEQIGEDIIKKEEKQFKKVQWDRKSRWLEGCLQRNPRNYVSTWQKQKRNKRKQRAAMKRSMSWAVI